MSRGTSIKLGALLFVGLGAAGIAWAIHRTGLDLPRLGDALIQLRWALTPLLGLVLTIYALDAWRYRLLGRACGVEVGWRAALEASVANFFFSWLTPGAALGAPAAIITLNRRGVPLDAAGLIAFGKSATSTLVVLLLALLVLSLGLGPAAPAAIRAPLISGLGVVLLVLALPLLAAIWPERAYQLRARWPEGSWRGRAAATLGDAVTRLEHLRAHGGLAPVFGAHLAYFAAFIGVAVIVIAALGGVWARSLGCATVLTAFSYVAPTPGGAGLTEAGADLLLGGALPPAAALSAVLIIRGLTFYLQILIGLGYALAMGGVWALDEERR